jgi:hypothetical protein
MRLSFAVFPQGLDDIVKYAHAQCGIRQVNIDSIKSAIDASHRSIVNRCQQVVLDLDDSFSRHSLSSVKRIVKCDVSITSKDFHDFIMSKL